MFATLRTTLFKMRAAAAHPRTSVCKGRRGTPGAQAPCVIAIYAESSWMLDAPRRMRRRLRRRRPQQARGRPHGLRSRCAWRARGRSDPSGGEPSRGRLASPHETRACKSELQGGRDSSSGGAEWAGPLSAWRTRARTASERAAAPPPAWWAGSSASAVGAPWRVRCRRGRELAPAVGPRQPDRAWRPVAPVLPCGASSGASARGLCLTRGGLPGRIRAWESDGSRRRRQRAISRSRCSGSVHTSETESPPATRRRMGGGGRRYPTSTRTITGVVHRRLHAHPVPRR